jgi:gas vesicle protein
MLLGLLVGAACGAAVALLMAPTTGREARQNLGRWARDARSKATDMAGNLRQRFQEQAESFTGSPNPGAPMNEDRNIPEL